MFVECISLNAKSSGLFLFLSNSVSIWYLNGRNLLEMTRKMEEFNAHNLKVDRWETYFDGLCKGIDDTLELLRIKPDSDEAHELKISERDFLLDGFPSMPDVLCPSFWERGTRFSDRTINNVLCFVKNIESTRIDKQC